MPLVKAASDMVRGVAIGSMSRKKKKKKMMMMRTMHRSTSSSPCRHVMVCNAHTKVRIAAKSTMEWLSTDTGRPSLE
jgi:hypothetical protein